MMIPNVNSKEWIISEISSRYDINDRLSKIIKKINSKQCQEPLVNKPVACLSITPKVVLDAYEFHHLSIDKWNSSCLKMDSLEFTENLTRKHLTNIRMQ